MTLQPFRCVISDNGRSAAMSRGAWSLTIPVGDLPKWLGLYRGFIKRRPSTERFHGGCVSALEAAMRQVGMATVDHAEKGARR